MEIKFDKRTTKEIILALENSLEHYLNGDYDLYIEYSNIIEAIGELRITTEITSILLSSICFITEKYRLTNPNITRDELLSILISEEKEYRKNNQDIKHFKTIMNLIHTMKQAD